MSQSPTLTLTMELMQRASVTPDDAGCQRLLAERLQAIGFDCESMPFGEVDNLWARYGSSSPLVVFAGHTDVVPVGDLQSWRNPPFEPTIVDGWLYGRGAADMKGSIAAFVSACERIQQTAKPLNGSIALLLTSDEEGPAINGTVKVIEALAQRGETPDFCIVGEPSSSEQLGDVVRHGRRGSLNGKLKLRGKQGHVAYPDDARNPIHDFAGAAAALCAERWDSGNDDFPPTSFQISNVNSGTGATNVIPGALEVLFNFRFSTEQTAAGLQDRVEAILNEQQLDYDIDWTLSGNPFLTRRGRLTETVQQAIVDECALQTQFSTGGGTSDARFIAPYGTEVVELGPNNATIHQIDERVPVAELDKLTLVYQRIVEDLLR